MTLRQLLWRLLRYQPVLYLLSAGSTILGVLLVLAPAFIARAVFDTLDGSLHPRLGVYGLAALLVLAELARVGTDACGTATSITASLTAKALLRKNLFHALLTRTDARSMAASSGEAISRFRDDVDYTEALLSGTLLKLGQALAALAAFLVMVRLAPLLTLVIVLPIGLLMLATQLAGSRLVAYRRADREAAGRVAGALGDMFGAVQAIKVANAEAHIVARFDALNEARRRTGLRDRVFTELLGSVAVNASTLGTGVTLLLAGRAIRNGEFTIGDFALFTTLLGIITVAIPAFAGTLTGYRQAAVSLGRLVALAPDVSLAQHGPVYLRGDYPVLPAVPKSARDRLERLTVAGLTYHHPDTEPGTGRGIDGIDLTLVRGSFTVITGRVGAGKTTLLRVLLGLLPRECGEMAWNGSPVPNPADFFVPPRCAYTPQVPRLFSESVRDNILLGLPVAQVDVPEAIRLAVLESDLAALEGGLDTIVGPRGVKLSGGQIQRTAAARMFISAAELLVVDDLSSALDVETERTLWERLLARRESTVLAVSHRRAVLQRADQIIVLQGGRVAAAGTLPDLLVNCAEMRRLWADNLGGNDEFSE